MSGRCVWVRVGMGAGSARAARLPRPIGRRWAALVSIAGLVVACSPLTTPPPTQLPTQQPMPAPTAPTSGAEAARTDTLRIGFVPGALERTYGLYVGLRQASDRFPWGILTPLAFAHAALYRPDDRFEPIPDLADGPCEPREADGTVIRCRLVEATFHDGTPVTAEDVAYTYRVFQHRPPFLPDIAGRLQEVQVVDGRTVDFVLSERDPTFLTESLQLIPILPRHVVEASFAEFSAATDGLRAVDLTKLADLIDDEIARDPPVCSPRLEAVSALLDRLGITVYREDFTDAATGTLDTCRYMAVASGYIRQTAVAMGKTGLDAVAAAWQLLGIDRRPIGAGPYRFVSEDAGGMHFEAWPAYHRGPPATRYLDFVATTADGIGSHRRDGRHPPGAPRAGGPARRRAGSRGPGRGAA